MHTQRPTKVCFNYNHANVILHTINQLYLCTGLHMSSLSIYMQGSILYGHACEI